MALKLTDLKTEVHNDWCPGCVTGDTLIVANPSVKPILEVQPGERVLTAAGEYKQVAARIAHARRPPSTHSSPSGGPEEGTGTTTNSRKKRWRPPA